MARRRRQLKPPEAHVGPAPVERPALLEHVPLLIRLEREVEDEMKPLLAARLMDRIKAEEAKLVGAPDCDGCGRRMRCRGRCGKGCKVLTRFGELELRGSAYGCKPCKRQRRPLLERLGVEPGHVSGSLARLLALLGVVVPYDLARRLAHMFFGVEVSSMTVWREVQRLGQAAEQYTQAQAAYHASPHSDSPAGDHAAGAVVLEADGSALGMQVRSKRRRRKGPEPLPPLPPIEEGAFREVKTGVLLLPSERTETTPGRRSVVRRVLCTCLGDADQIFDRLWAKLMELGWMGPQTVVVIVGDGAEWIWNRAARFPRRCEILDFWHAVEYAWGFARVQYGEDSKKATTWVTRVAEDLRAGRVQEVLKRLHALSCSTNEQREKLADLIRYYTTHVLRMRYDEYIRLGYGIGSGAVESAHKQVVHARLRQAGMRWSELGAQHLLALRVLLLNDQWSVLDRLPRKRLAA